MLIASVLPWFYLIARWRRYGYILPYEPRRPVPWGFAGAMLAVAFTGLTIMAAVASDGHANHGAPSAREEPGLLEVLHTGGCGCWYGRGQMLTLRYWKCSPSQENGPSCVVIALRMRS